MSSSKSPRTRLQQVLAAQHMTVGVFCEKFTEITGDPLSERQAYRWISGNLKTFPYPQSQAALEQMFDEPAGQLLGLPFDVQVPGCAASSHVQTFGGQMEVIEMSADRARDFLTNAESTNVGSETIEELAGTIRRLVVEYPQRPLGHLLKEIVRTQDSAFKLLEGRQRPSQTVDLYLLAGVSSGLMARASHDLGSSSSAMTQARAAFVCADNAGHSGLRSWARGLQSLIAYWAGDLNESIRYAELGQREISGRGHGSAAVWVSSNYARSLAAHGRAEDALVAIRDGVSLRESAVPDELDTMGGLCLFSQPRQLYYAAETLAWCGAPEAGNAENLASDAIRAYSDAPSVVRSFGDEAGARCALAIARLRQGEISGAREAMQAVLQLPVAQRNFGVITAVAHVSAVLGELPTEAREALELSDAIRTFRSEQLAITQ